MGRARLNREPAYRVSSQGIVGPAHPANVVRQRELPRLAVPFFAACNLEFRRTDISCGRSYYKTGKEPSLEIDLLPSSRDLRRSGFVWNRSGERSTITEVPAGVG